MKNGVYQIRNLINGKRYIGSAAGVNGLRHRWMQHQSLLRRNQHYARYLQNAWNKYGADAFVFEILLYCDPENCLMYEQVCLDYFTPEYNSCPRAGSCYGRQYSDLTLAKMRHNNTGAGNPFFGKRHSATTRKRISESKKGLHTGIKNPSCKLTEDEVKDIKSLLERNTPRQEIAKQFRISLATISDIVTGKRWRHV